MWIFTRWGFLSIVQHNAMPGHFQVKARVIDPLENLWPEHERDGKLFMVFDDRQKVVDMWRKNKVTCLQVAEGNF